MSLLFAMITALLLTLLFELSYAWVWGLRKKQLVMVILMNLMTNPAANALYSYAVTVLSFPSAAIALPLEAAAMIAEGLCCRNYIKKPWLFVITCNVFSYAAGMLLQIFIRRI